jgi:hypothetical protein
MNRLLSLMTAVEIGDGLWFVRVRERKGAIAAMEGHEMLKYGLAALVLVSAIGAVDAQSDSGRAADHARSEQAAPAGVGAPDCRPPRIRNRVLDLLDDEIVLDSASEHTTWQSQPFDTSQYTRVGVRVATQEDSDPVVCSLWWQFTEDDTFLPGPPSAAPRLIGDDRRLELVGLAPINFSAVFGLRARAVCQLFLLPDFGGPEPPPPASAVVSDVKVLLRLE